MPPQHSTLRRSPRLSLPPHHHPHHRHRSNQSLALALHHEPTMAEEAEPKPLKVYHPTKSPSPNKALLLSSASFSSSTGKKTTRRSPRLMAASIGVVTSGKCGSAMLLKLPDSSEKKACQLTRAFLADTDFNVKCLRSQRLPAVASSPLPSCGKRKLDSRKICEDSEEMPVNRGSLRSSRRFSEPEFVDSLACRGSTGKSRRKSARESEKAPLALPSSSMVEDLGKSTKLVPRRNSEKRPENRKMMRRSARFSDPESVESPACKELTGATKANSVRKSNDIIPSSAAGNLGKFRKLDSRKNSENSEFAEKSPASCEFMRRSPRFSDAGSVESPPCKKEIVGTTEENLAKESDDIDTSSSMAEKVEKIEEEKVLRRSPRGLGSISLVDDYGCDEMRELELESPKKKKKKEKKAAPERREEEGVCDKKSENYFFIGEPVLEEEARQRWGWRYELKNRRVKSRSFTANAEEEDEPILKVKCHYTQAQINGCIFNLGDCALIRGEGRQEHIGKITEFFQTVEALDYFRVQWFYKAEDTVLKEVASFHDKKRIFYSTIMNDNLLDCIICKVNVVQITPQLNLESSTIPPSDFYYDMEYCLEYSTFRNLPGDYTTLNSPESVLSLNSTPLLEDISTCEPRNAELTMLDLYAGCGAMSTGLCIGARLAGVDLVTRWAIDCDSAACESLRLNHPETQVRNEEAEDFLELLKHWEKLCKKFVSGNGETPSPYPEDSLDGAESSDAQSDDDNAADELEVSSLVDICYGDTGESGKSGVKFKVRWKGYGPSEDTWEPIEGLSNCQDLIQEFVTKGFKNKILPFPGDIDVICGGPPCQGISGYNRFRSFDAPLADERNRQLVVFMDIVEYLKPKFVLMENVTDILRFDKASLGRYALSRLVHMNYQARVGIMAAGCYGLPQFRLRVFFWGALPIEELPQFPLPTHDVVVRYWPPPEFERNVVAYEEGQPSELEDAVFLRDAISDLPEVTNYESSDEMPYSRPPETEFQKYIRSTNYEMIGSASSTEADVLYDHRPHQVFEDDYVRVRQIPHRKGANFRDLPGILVGDDNVVRRDPKEKPVLLPSGMPMVPEYVFTFEQGKSKRPFARLWWDETMPTVITYPNCHSQAVLHPEQDRVLTVREWARLQGFPDSYRFCGTVKKRYRQVGNAVAIPVAKALGYALGMASQKLIGKEPLTTLPPKFAYSYRL